MTTPRESRAKALNALAAVIHEIRPEWAPPGIVAALRGCPDDLAIEALGIAALRYAGDPANVTPAHIADLGNRAWDSDWFLPCKVHPETRTRRTNGECGSCYADRNAVTEPQPLNRHGVPPQPDVRAQIIGAITALRLDAEPARRTPAAEPEAMAQVRAELDALRPTCAVDPTEGAATPTGSTEETA